jgi:hypothetical protein
MIREMITRTAAAGSARRGQHALELESLILAGQGDFELSACEPCREALEIQVRPATLMAGMGVAGVTALAVGGPGVPEGIGRKAASVGASAAGRVIQTPYLTGGACCPWGGGGRNETTGETAAEVIVTGVPVLR